jgi:lysophospholipase L1-like esterase
MRERTGGVCALLISLALTGAAARADGPAPAPAPTTAPARKAYPADEPAEKLRDGKPDPRFEKLHASFLARGKAGPIGVLFLGDSITEGWGKAPDVWKQHYGACDPANFGIGGDRTEHVLWRIDNGELDGIHPKVLVLMIGTNNIGDTAAHIERADEKIVAEIHQKLPDTKLLLLGIFPRGANPADPKVAVMRDKIKAVNAGLAKLEDGKQTRYLDIGDKFLAPDGKLTKDIMPDALHPNVKGYTIWADAMQPLLDEMLKATP